MKKYLVVIIAFLYSSYCFSQVGVNATLPLHPVHVDAKGNNPKDKLPNAVEAEDDFVITKEGNVGIGIINPSEKLEVKGTIRLIDGVDGTNKAVTSDADGILRKESLPEVKRAVVGSFAGGNVTNSTTQAGYVFANASITLTKGRWIVNWGLTMDLKDTGGDLWLESCLSTTNNLRAENGFNFVGNPVNKPSIGSNLAKKPQNQASSTGNFDMIKGSNVIDVTAASVVIYILLKKDGNWSYGPNSWENYLYALPMK
ncbi:MAG: hypothetical protein LBI73_03065 [Myroides sp.]|jgi:hypothetical protein|nr:hypothetical protein [Myroides sp.]